MAMSRAGSNQSEVSTWRSMLPTGLVLYSQLRESGPHTATMNGMAADVDRRIGARSFARLLGDWRPPGGRGLTAALADRVRLLVFDGRLPLQMRVPAERELA